MSGRLSAILDNLERVSQDPACPLEELQLLVEEADRECIVNPEEGSVISHFLNEMKAIISSRGDQVADKFEADRAKTGVFLCMLPTFVSPPVVDDTMNLNSLCVCMWVYVCHTSCWAISQKPSVRFQPYSIHKCFICGFASYILQHT